MSDALELLVVVKTQTLGLVLDVIVAEHTEEGGNLLDGVFGVGTYLLALQTQHHSAVEGIEASLNLAHILVATIAQFDDKGQHLIIFGVVEGKTRRKIKRISECEDKTGSDTLGDSKAEQYY